MSPCRCVYVTEHKYRCIAGLAVQNSCQFEHNLHHLLSIVVRQYFSERSLPTVIQLGACFQLPIHRFIAYTLSVVVQYRSDFVWVECYCVMPI